ncbi:hypothetical protein HPB50_026152 [Hyalomma asiaticum]|uniref:Uncharacterized protein n=1 Tax=Hyalomma asiaticum TaxID=266040 RepID=A0ACB7SZR3_HYAAI|nr:hypothetical protein HPB50_026152 [Hyalomma asiaticum]
MPARRTPRGKTRQPTWGANQMIVDVCDSTPERAQGKAGNLHGERNADEFSEANSRFGSKGDEHPMEKEFASFGSISTVHEEVVVPQDDDSRCCAAFEREVGTTEYVSPVVVTWGTGTVEDSVDGPHTRLLRYDTFALAALRRKVHGYFMRNEIPTAEKLRNDVISDTDMDMPTISTRTMQRMLNDLGFLFRKRKRNSALLERDDIVAWRRKYLRTIREMRRQQRWKSSLFEKRRRGAARVILSPCFDASRLRALDMLISFERSGEAVYVRKKRTQRIESHRFPLSEQEQGERAARARGQRGRVWSRLPNGTITLLREQSK